MPTKNVMKTGNMSVEQKEDTWSWVEIGEPFPDGPIKAKGAMNEYVALWYKHGKPVCGRAWNNGGVVECSFPYGNKELTGKNQLGGKIQILSYDKYRPDYEAWADCGYVYEWVKWKDVRNQPHIQLVKCDKSTPIQMAGSDGTDYAGNLDMVTETASVSFNKKAESKTTGIGELYTIVRNLKCPFVPPTPEEPPVELPKIYEDTWMDLRESDDFRRCKYGIMALGRPLKQANGKTEEVYVALWYMCGIPIMGRIFNQGGKLAAVFGWEGKQYDKNVGSLQVLAYDKERAGFEISWQPYKIAATVGGEWKPVKVKDSAPCVIITKDGSERLGNVYMSQEKAGVAHDGKEETFVGPQVQSFLVLCRKDKVK